MAKDHFDCCIVGAGVVGLAIARAFSRQGRSTIVLEQSPTYGTGISSRNSEVIHAGLYYPTDSLKAKLCLRGNQLLYEYCEKRRIPHRRIGKLIVATEDTQLDRLSALAAQAQDNGVSDLQWLSRTQINALEPAVRAQQALLSPSTGIIDSHSLMSSLLLETENAGGLLCLNTEFLAAHQLSNGFEVQVVSVGEPYRFQCELLINAAGLGAQSTALRIDGCPREDVPPLHLGKGCYFSLSGAAPFSHLIYPLPPANHAGLGIHATLDMAGQVRFGPDIDYVDHEDYSVAAQKLTTFAAAIQQYYPALCPAQLLPAYAGIRPKIQGPNEPARDFFIRRYGSGLINLFGIESPGLTAALAIAELISNDLH